MQPFLENDNLNAYRLCIILSKKLFADQLISKKELQKANEEFKRIYQIDKTIDYIS